MPDRDKGGRKAAPSANGGIIEEGPYGVARFLTEVVFRPFRIGICLGRSYPNGYQKSDKQFMAFGSLARHLFSLFSQMDAVFFGIDQKTLGLNALESPDNGDVRDAKHFLKIGHPDGFRFL
jgi:hypothetical protein